MEKSKVAVVACPDYEPARVKESLQKGLEAIGSLESLIGKEENILLKPNLVRSAKRERAVVTDPEVMDALITILQENGYENISCGDSCGLGTPEGIAKEAGLKEVLEKHNVPLKDFLTSERVETADGKFLMIAKDALDCEGGRRIVGKPSPCGGRCRLYGGNFREIRKNAGGAQYSDSG